VARLTLIRNATVILELDGQRLLIDPMLDEAGTRPAVENTENLRRNPLVPLPLPVEEIVAGLDAILVTHSTAITSTTEPFAISPAMFRFTASRKTRDAYAPSASRRFPFMTGSNMAT
jgi:hypothetical protein